MYYPFLTYPNDPCFQHLVERIECPECNGNGKIYFYASTGAVITAQEYDIQLLTGEEEVMCEVCEHCDGQGEIDDVNERDYDMEYDLKYDR